MGRRATRGENVDRTDGAGLAVFRDDEFWCNVHSSAKARDGGDRAGPLRGSRRERRVRRLADESRHLHRVLVARLVAPLDALPRFGPRGAKRGGVIRATTDTTDNRVERWVKFLRTVCPCRNFREFRDMSETPIWGSLTPNRAFFWAFLAIRSPFPDGGPFGGPIRVSVARAARWARGRQMCVPPARKERNGVPMIGRMGGGAKGTHPSAFKPRATARPFRRSRGALSHPKSPPFRPCVFLPSPPSLGR